MNNLYKIAENVEEYEINILPMIDVIFAILTFFIISSLSLVKLETIPLNLPSASTSSISKDEIINVSISNGKKIFLNKEEVSLEKLNQKLKVINSEKMKKVIISTLSLNFLLFYLQMKISPYFTYFFFYVI